MGDFDGIAERRARIERAGWNVMNLDPTEVEVDLVTDVPPRSYLRPDELEAGPALAEGVEPDLGAAARALYGPFHYVFTGKGRAAEIALGAAIVERGGVVLVHPLFKTTQASLVRPGAVVEVIPRGDNAVTTSVDLAWLERRLGQGGVQAVYLEPGTNALGGLPLSLDHLASVRERCEGAGARLLLDCARLIANVLRQDPHADRAQLQRYTALADAFTVSCAKELRVAYGALVGVRDLELQRRIFSHAFDEGTLLEPLLARRALSASLRADGIAAVRRRQGQLERLARALRGAGVPFREPIGGHAVYVPFPAERLAVQLANRAFEAQLFIDSCARTLLSPYPALGGPHLRLAVAVDRYSDDVIDRVAPALAALMARTEPPVALAPSPGVMVHDLFARFALRS